MLESLRGPKGSIIEGILPFVMLLSIICWLAFVRYRRYKGRPLSSDAAWGWGGFLLISEMFACVAYPVYLGSRGKLRLLACDSNMKQIQSGIVQYAQDWDEILPVSSRWADQAVLEMRQTSKSDVWHCPNGSSPYSYAFNQALGGLPEDALDDAANTVCVFESDASRWNASGGKSAVSQEERHSGLLTTSFGDGHVRATSKQKLTEDLRWQPLYLAKKRP